MKPDVIANFASQTLSCWPSVQIRQSWWCHTIPARISFEEDDETMGIFLNHHDFKISVVVCACVCVCRHVHVSAHMGRLRTILDASHHLYLF